MKITIIQGDITELEVHAIVNAAKNSLAGGSGVDGFIHEKAGSELLKECKTLGGCETGEAKITKGYNLKAKNIIHTVGPVFFNGEYNEGELLASCYKNCIKVAEENNCKTIAFPCISTGGYSFPHLEAAIIVERTLKEYKSNKIDEVILCCYDKENFNMYMKIFEKNLFKRVISKSKVFLSIDF